MRLHVIYCLANYPVVTDLHNKCIKIMSKLFFISETVKACYEMAINNCDIYI